MVEAIKSTKDMLLKRLEQVINEKGPERMNIQEAGMLSDQIKDLAEAEKSCWEAEYYRAVTEAMEGPQGYSQLYPTGHADGMRMGYNQNRDSMGRYTSGGRRGYGTDAHEPIEAIRSRMGSASPEEREKMKRELRQIIES